METQIQSSEQVFLPSCDLRFSFLSLMCFVDLEKAYYCVSSGVLREVLLEYRVLGLRVNLLILKARGLFVFLASGGCQTQTRVLDIPSLVCDIYKP